MRKKTCLRIAAGPPRDSHRPASGSQLGPASGRRQARFGTGIGPPRDTSGYVGGPGCFRGRLSLALRLCWEMVCGPGPRGL
ncbi:hypothetical protein T484DRAFT_1875032 [Baffinella frigidus]|nr:hypothetical protein T484DRAFT_1875032 [Cryptophyta sp. CCMP2293]